MKFLKAHSIYNQEFIFNCALVESIRFFIFPLVGGKDIEGVRIRLTNGTELDAKGTVDEFIKAMERL